MGLDHDNPTDQKELSEEIIKYRRGYFDIENGLKNGFYLKKLFTKILT